MAINWQRIKTHTDFRIERSPEGGHKRWNVCLLYFFQDQLMKNTFIKRTEIDIINRISPVINFYDTVYFLKIFNSKRVLILHQTLADSTRGRRFSRGFILITVNRNKETQNKGNTSSVKSRTQRRCGKFLRWNYGNFFDLVIIHVIFSDMSQDAIIEFCRVSEIFHFK